MLSNLKYNSLAVKNALIYFVLFLSGIGLLGYLLLQYSSKEILKSSERKLIHSSELVNLKFTEHLEFLQHDINYLSKSPLLINYLNTRDTLSKALIEQEYLNLLKSKPYSQIRYIGLENGGKEVVRVERKGNLASLISEPYLQKKGNRDYFIETIRMPPDSLYISPINLNREYGQISEPFTPTLRVAYPVYSNDRIHGIVIINAELSQLFNSLNQIVDVTSSLRIVNEEGYYLLNENATQTFGFEFSKAEPFSPEFNALPSAMVQNNSNGFVQNGRLYTINELYFPRKDYRLFTLVSADKAIVLASYFNWRRNSFIIILSLGILFLLIAFFYLNRQANELIEITNRLKAFPQNLKVANLPINRNDEIGDLANSFNQMSELVLLNMESLEKAKNEAEQAVKDKEEFLENISHEIRNPLQSIYGLCNILESNNPMPYQEKLINSLKFNTSNLKNLVNDILDYKKLLRGEAVFNNEWFSIEKFIEEISRSIKYLAPSKGLSLSTQIDPLLQEKEVYTDKTRLSQILYNLLVNATKFTTKEGEIIIKLNVHKPTKEGYKIRFAVLDTGIGIDNRLQEKIKERYYSHNIPLSSPDSFGIGLNIVVEILKSYQTELKINSVQGQGAEFYFNIDLQVREKSNQAAPLFQTSKNQVFSELHLLIIEDDPQITSLYQHVFDPLFRSITYVKNKETLEALPLKTYQVVLMDYRLGDKSAEDLFPTVKKYSDSTTLFYFVSAEKLEIRDPNIAKEVKHRFLKPVNVQTLLNKINEDCLIKEFGEPSLELIKKDYDYNQDKYTKAIRILLNEWSQMADKLQAAILTNDSKTVYDVTHKLITTIRRLQLEKFENILADLKHDFNSADSKKYVGKINLAMGFYEDHIKQSIL